MAAPLMSRAADAWRLVHASARLIAGRRYWIAPLLPLVWVAFQILRLLVGWESADYVPIDAQTLLIGFPLSILAVGLGVRIIAGDIDRRTLEIAYTVPGGTQRVWLAKLAAAVLILVAAEALLAAATAVFCTGFPAWALYGALQSAVFYLVLAMGLSVLTRSEAAGALVTALVLVLNFPFQQGNVRFSPFWNGERALAQSTDPAEVLAHAVQNRIGFALAIGAIVILSFAASERRERLL